MSPSPLPALGAPIGVTPRPTPEAAYPTGPDPEFDALVAGHRETDSHSRSAPDRTEPAIRRNAPHDRTRNPDRPADKHDAAAVDHGHDGAAQPPAQQAAAATDQQAAAAAGATPTPPGVTSVSATAPAQGSSAAPPLAGFTSGNGSVGSVAATGTGSRPTTAAPPAPGTAGTQRTAGRGIGTDNTPAPMETSGAADTKPAAAGTPATTAATSGGAVPPARVATGAAQGPGASSGVHPAPSPDHRHQPSSTESRGATAAPPTTIPSAGAAAGVAPQTGVGAAAAGAGQATGQPAPAATIPAQLQPTVARLISRGDGTHRMSMQLHPAELGEVRVTVTVQNGMVDVSLAAGHAAQDALRDGAAQLRAMLSSSGHTLGQLMLRDLPGAVVMTTQNSAGQNAFGQNGTGQAGQPPQGQAGGQGQSFGQAPQHQGQHAAQQQLGQQTGQQLGQQSGQQSGQPWSTGDSPGGRDGSADPVTAVASPRRTASPGDPNTRTAPTTGLDVRI